MSAFRQTAEKPQWRKLGRKAAARPALDQRQFWEEFERTLTTEIIKDFGRLWGANSSNAGTRGRKAVGYGFFWPPERMRNASSGASIFDANRLVVGGIEQVLEVRSAGFASQNSSPLPQGANGLISLSDIARAQYR